MIDDLKSPPNRTKNSLIRKLAVSPFKPGDEFEDGTPGSQGGRSVESVEGSNGGDEDSGIPKHQRCPVTKK